MLKVSNLTKIFPAKRRLFGPQKPDFVAVNNISFEIEQGDVVGILGPNGAGKTTTIKMLLDIMTPTSGSIEYFGKNLQNNRTSILQHVGFASTYTKLPARLSVQQNLEIYGKFYNVPASELQKRIHQYLSQFGMEDRMHQEMGSLSAGQMTRVMLAKAFLVRPKIVLLDEPTAALDPDIALEVRTFILQQQQEHGMTVLIASHNMDEVAAICNRVIVLSNGTIIDDDTPDQLAKQISHVRISLIVLDGMKRIVAHAQQMNIPFTVQDRSIELVIDEAMIAPLLAAFAKLDVNYTHIWISKPTLEDYFIEIARSTKKAKKKG